MHTSTRTCPLTLVLVLYGRSVSVGDAGLQERRSLVAFFCLTVTTAAMTREVCRREGGVRGRRRDYQQCSASQGADKEPREGWDCRRSVYATCVQTTRPFLGPAEAIETQFGRCDLGEGR